MSGIVDPVAVTNLRGEFLLTSKSPIKSITAKVQARGLASKIFRELEPTAPKQELKLGRGVTVTGRILHQGKPLAGVIVGLAQARRTPEDFLGPTQIATDASGRFVFSSVAPGGQGTKFSPAVAHNYPPDDLYYLYDPTTQELQTASLKTPAPTRVLQHVLAYQSYGANTLLYVTASEAPAGKV